MSRYTGEGGNHNSNSPPRDARSGSFRRVAVRRDGELVNEEVCKCCHGEIHPNKTIEEPHRDYTPEKNEFAMTDKNYISPDKDIEFKKGRVHITNSEHVSAVFSKHKSSQHNAMHLDCPDHHGPVSHTRHEIGSGHKIGEERIAHQHPHVYDNLANATH